MAIKIRLAPFTKGGTCWQINPHELRIVLPPRAVTTGECARPLVKRVRFHYSQLGVYNS